MTEPLRHTFAIAIVVIAVAAPWAQHRLPPSSADAAQAAPPVRLRSLDAVGVIPYFIAEGLKGSGYRPGDTELATWALREWERHAGGALRFRPADNEEASLIRIHWLPWAADADLGRMEPSIANGRAIASVLIRPDEEKLRPNTRRRVREDPLMRDVIVYFVCLHEIGHALGLSHSPDLRDVMWSGGNGVTLPVYDRYRKRLQDRGSIAQVSWLSSHDIARLRALWAR